jgi:predicted ATPase/DNA-binding SARP family transcriptional activator/Tfp pilus assembly protein PilF
MPLHLHLFGPPRIVLDGAESALPLERRHQLLVLLALRRGWVGRAELAALFWPELDGKLAFANLRKTLFRLQAQPWGAAVEVQGSALRLADAQTDVAAFDAAVAEGRIDAALALCRGDLLEGYDDGASAAWSAWLGVERERLRGTVRDAAHARLAAAAAPAEGVTLSGWLLGIDPFDETALCAHMGWLARAGQPARARQAYREYADRLAADYDLSPGHDLRALHDALGSTAGPAPAPPPPAAPAGDGFVGRATELRRIGELLGQDGVRLVSIVGPGGMGKTRLARRALDVFGPGHAGGAAFVALEDVPAADAIGARIARELGLAPAGRRDALDAVLAHLRGRRVLLVLDNLEHLAGAAPVLERLLGAGATLLATSRVRLALAGEWLVPLEGLPCPDAEDREQIDSFDAVRLFVLAAGRVGPALVPASEADAIIDICRQVEGLPLALELAASWTRVLSCEAIAAELRRGTELLHVVDPARPARHASIEVVFEQSWQRLGAAERDALVRLAVFRGGFTPAAARSVAGVSLPVLGALADKSLLRKEGMRLSMHALVQQLAAQRLDAAAERETARAHALHFQAWLAATRRPVEDGERTALQALDAEFENCRAAWAATLRHGTVESLGRCAVTLLHYCDHRGRFEEGLALMRAGLETAGPDATPIFGAPLFAAAAHLAYRLDRYAEAEADARRGLAASRPARDPQARLQCYKVLGSCALRVEAHDAARRHFRRALRLAQAAGDAHNTAALLGNLALVEKAAGRYAETLRLSLLSLVEHRRLGDAASEALCLNNLGSLHADIGEPGPALAYLREALALCDSHGFAGTRTFVLSNLTEIALKQGDADAAEAHGRRAFDGAQATGNRSVLAWLHVQFVRLALQRADLAAARREVGAAAALAIELRRPTLQLSGVTCFAELLAAQGEIASARRVLRYAAGHATTSPLQRTEMLAILARWPADAADTDEAPASASAWTGPQLDELVHRIAVEAELGHAPLIAALRTAV